MIQTTIYLSVINGKDTLTLDGNLYLFGELLTTLSEASRQLTQAEALALPAEDLKQSEGGTHVTAG
jgi:hypothetical protein